MSCAECTTCGSSATTSIREAQTAPLVVRQGLREVDPDPCRIRRRNGAAGRVRGVRRGRLHQGPHRLHDDPKGRSGGRLRRGAPRRARLRPAPRLPRSRSLRRACRTTRRSATRCWRRCSRTTTDSDGLVPAVVARGVGGRGQGGARRRRDRERRRATASSSPPARSATRRRRRPGSGAGAVIRVMREEQGTLGDRPDAAGRVRVRLDAAPATARSCRWSAASTSTATSSTT